MKTRFWGVYALFAVVLLGAVYFSTAQMSNVPLALSDTEMETLFGGLSNWKCYIFPPECTTTPCNNNTLTEIHGNTWCKACETSPGSTCTHTVPKTYCQTCAATFYSDVCHGTVASVNATHYRGCDN